MKFESEYKTFHSWKCIWKCRLSNWQPRSPGGYESIHVTIIPIAFHNWGFADSYIPTPHIPDIQDDVVVQTCIKSNNDFPTCGSFHLLKHPDHQLAMALFSMTCVRLITTMVFIAWYICALMRFRWIPLISKPTSRYFTTNQIWTLPLCPFFRLLPVLL